MKCLGSDSHMFSKRAFYVLHIKHLQLKLLESAIYDIGKKFHFVLKYAYMTKAFRN